MVHLFIRSIAVEYLILVLVIGYWYRVWNKRRLLLQLHYKHQSKLLLYGADWSIASIKTAALLGELLEPFTLLDIKDEAVRSEWRSLGSSVPTLLINGTVIHGYKPKQIKKLVSKRQ